MEDELLNENPLAGVDVRGYIQFLSNLSPDTRIDAALEKLAKTENINLRDDDKNAMVSEIGLITKERYGKRACTLGHLHMFRTDSIGGGFASLTCSHSAFPFFVAVLALISNSWFAIGVECLSHEFVWQTSRLFRGRLYDVSLKNVNFFCSIFNCSDSKISEDAFLAFSKRIGIAPEYTYVSRYKSSAPANGTS
jgi:hypothetical protein